MEDPGGAAAVACLAATPPPTCQPPRPPIDVPAHQRPAVGDDSPQRGSRRQAQPVQPRGRGGGDRVVSAAPP